MSYSCTDSMKIGEWIRFEDARSFITSKASPDNGLLPILHTRDSYIEEMFGGLILVPHRCVAHELSTTNFAFQPKNYRHRLVRRTNRHFLGRSLRSCSALTCRDPTNYTDSSGQLAAERRGVSNGFESADLITLRADILAAYCDQRRLVPIWVTDSSRYSEQPPAEIGLPLGRRDFRDSTYCYFHLVSAPKAPWNRPRMQTRSRICGKRLLFQ